MEIKVIADRWMMPERQHQDDAGADLKADATWRIEPGRTRMVRTGTRWEIPSGHVGLVFARSSLAVEKGLMLANGVGVIDAGYQGEVMVPLHNCTGTFVTIDEGERIAQMVIVSIATPRAGEGGRFRRDDGARSVRIRLHRQVGRALRNDESGGVSDEVRGI